MIGGTLQIKPGCPQAHFPQHCSTLPCLSNTYEIVFTLRLNLKFPLLIDTVCTSLNIWPIEATSILQGSHSHCFLLIRTGHLLLHYSPVRSTPAGLQSIWLDKFPYVFAFPSLITIQCPCFIQKGKTKKIKPYQEKENDRVLNREPYSHAGKKKWAN